MVGRRKTVTFDGEGVPAAPVQLGGCVHAAWSGANKYVRDWSNDADDKNVAVPKASASPSYVFRVNRDLVVLNDVNSGNVWLVNQNMQLVNNWDDVIPPKQTSDDAGQGLRGRSPADRPARTAPNPTAPRRPNRTAIGVRAGKTTILPVLDNDSDPDGDVLTVRTRRQPRSQAPLASDLRRHRLPGHRPRRQDRLGNVQIHGGRRPRAVRHRRGHAQRRPAGRKQGAARTSRNRNTTLVVQQGKVVSQNILTDWIDPDGDDLFAVGASRQRPPDQVRSGPTACSPSRTRGATAGQQNRHRHRLGRPGHHRRQGQPSTSGRPEPCRPIANADHVVAVAGPGPVIAPLKNDIGPPRRRAPPRPGDRRTATSDGRVIGADQQTFTLQLHRSRARTTSPTWSPTGPPAPSSWCASTSCPATTTAPRWPSATSRCCPAAAACWWMSSATTPTPPAASWWSSP